MTTERAADQWDVFISYAREDYVQAKDLHDALLECVTERGGTPRVFLDLSRTGMPAGADWQSYLEEALRNTRHVVALYSRTYFEKDVCQWELHKAYELRLTETGRFIPLLMDPGAAKKVPYVVNRINWIPATRPRWLDEVRQALGLSTTVARPALRFDAPTGDAVVGHTLPPLTVRVSSPKGAPAWPEGGMVSLSAQPSDAGLTGTLAVPVTGGAAVFGDLAFGSAATEAVLVATAPGCEPVATAPFPVRAPREQSSWDGVDRPVLAARGRPVFFPDGRTPADLDGRTLTVHALTGAGYEAVGTAELRERPRLWAHGRRRLAVADWSGRVVVADPDGTTRAHDLPVPEGARLNVPGALAFDGDDVLYVGMWSGQVWRLSPDAEEPEPVLIHPAGVQVLAADGERLLVGGLDGRLTEYAGRRIAAEHLLEPVLLGIARVRDFALVVGEQRVHRLDLTGRQLLQVTQPVTAVTGVLAGGELTTIVDAKGQGVCFDGELAVRVGFRTVPGARPVGSALGGRLLVLEHPDGSHALVREGRTTYVCGHPLAVSPDGSVAAVSDGRRLLILPVAELGGEGTRA
ncbi:TIR domain-containing protein [Streptomyces sp. WI04-05B]|uniref:TIR domain-containing protein n=1 Tax=Streptomyces TaxID=1883 RepID=UPI0029BA5890|nr:MULTISPECIES: TIR domain-containing protein [unclassified Streptomyces]MDX2543288.1 TIR domain-containing protein [Streptomyces sp. WI04-05B]MDX2586690.1 TIR domain-containing protein [Streptomyces sp. WI04-05A]